MAYLLNRRTAFRSTGSANFSSWTFDITKTTYDNASKVIYTSPLGSTFATPTYFNFMRLVNGDSELVCASRATSYIYKYLFSDGNNGDINYINEGYSSRSALISGMNSFFADYTGKRLLCQRWTNTGHKLGNAVIDSAYDISSIPLFPVENSLDVAPNTLPSEGGYGCSMSNDGLQAFLLSQDTKRTFIQYTLQTPFVLSSSKLSTVSVNMVDFSSTVGHWYTFCFSPDGYRIVFVGTDKINVFDLAVPFDIGTMSFSGVYTSQYASLRGVCINEAGTKLYVSSGAANAIYQFSLSA